MTIHNTAIQILNDLKSAISQLEETIFKQKIDLLFNASIGQHCRHIIEFFQCLEQQSQNGLVCYDLRKRQLLIEECPNEAQRAIDEIIAWIGKSVPDKNLELIVNHELNENEIVDVIKSSLNREIVFNIEHAIHHMAIIKTGIKIIAPEIILSNQFGVAPSTIRYQNQLLDNKIEM